MGKNKKHSSKKKSPEKNTEPQNNKKPVGVTDKQGSEPEKKTDAPTDIKADASEKKTDAQADIKADASDKKAAPETVSGEAEESGTEEGAQEKKPKGKAAFYAGKALRSISFFLILGTILGIFSYAVHPKNNKKEYGMRDQNAHAFYAEPENTLDTIIIGNSEAYSSFSPLEMWHAYGITSYVSAKGAILMSDAYYILKEVLKTQSPKLVIFETDAVFPQKEDQTRRDRTINNVIENESPLIKYHDVWKIQRPENYFAPINYRWQSYSRGQMDDPRTEGYESRNLVVSDGKNEVYRDGRINYWILKYMDKFVELCREKNIQVLFVTVPNILTTSKLNSQAIKNYCTSRNIPQIDFSEHPEFINIDWTKDTRDGGVHMNTRGAKKVSLFLGQYIINQYDIKDRRDDKELAKRWDRDYKRYKNEVQIKRKKLLGLM